LVHFMSHGVGAGVAWNSDERARQEQSASDAQSVVPSDATQ
jgi:hypothetical protein